MRTLYQYVLPSALRCSVYSYRMSVDGGGSCKMRDDVPRVVDLGEQTAQSESVDACRPTHELLTMMNETNTTGLD